MSKMYINKEKINSLKQKIFQKKVEKDISNVQMSNANTMMGLAITEKKVDTSLETNNMTNSQMLLMLAELESRLKKIEESGE